MAISDVSVGVMMDNLNVLPRYNQCVVVILVVYHDAPNKIIHKKFRGGLKKMWNFPHFITLQGGGV